MLTFSGNNINDVYFNALTEATISQLEQSESRVGNTLDFGPSYFEFKEPENQILTLRKRNYNPYFAIMEAAWILSGDNSLQPLRKILKNYDRYSDDGKTLNGAYGFRIRKTFGFDQLTAAISALKSSPNTRRVAISLYSPADLRDESSLDIPCNTTLFLKIKHSKLDLTVINRSNDLFLGIPYNVFVFNCIQKYIAHHLGITTGTQRHYTDCLHVYCKDMEKIKLIVQSNSQDEIDHWKTKATPTALYECLISEHNKILQFRSEELNCTYTSNIIKNYNNYQNSKNKTALKETLPHDILGLSTLLWLESEI